MNVAVYMSAFAVALFGGFHCAAMCGGIIMAVEQTAVPLFKVTRFGLWFSQLLMQLGRITTYTLLGLLAGGLGAAVWKNSGLPIQRLAFGIGSLLLVLYGLFLLSKSLRWRIIWLERPVMSLLQNLRRRFALPLARLFPPDRLWKRYVIGLGWGLVPCGMIYGVLALALLAGSAISGALVMLAFGFGTLPNLMLMSGLVGSLRFWSRRPAVRIGSGLIVMMFGMLGLWRLWVLPQTLSGYGLCLTP